MHIKELKPNQIFVFGSNTEGRHGAGAAKQAMKWGAVYGQATGRMGQTYAICTKELSAGYRSISLSQIKDQLVLLSVYANAHEDLEFLLTPIGTGLGGYSVEDLENILPELPTNVVLTWKE